MMKILIIKFAAIGDVLRTTPILCPLKKKYPKAKIYWLTEKISYGVLCDNPFIDKVILYNRANLAILQDMSFNILINLDKDKRAAGAANTIPAKIKKGFGQMGSGQLAPFDKDSDYAYRLGIDDELKFRRNKKTYQQISFEQIGFKFQGEKYIYDLKKKDMEFAKKKLKKNGDSPLRGQPPFLKVGIVTGSGKAFAGKRLPFNSYVKIIQGLLHYDGIQVLLLGGPEERWINLKIINIFENAIVDTGCNNTIGEFAAIVNNCDIIITGDTLTMHLGIATGKHVMVYFGSTTPNEIELYGKGEKIIPKIKCSPCYKKDCLIKEKCLQLINPETIVESVVGVSRKVFKRHLMKKMVFIDRDGVINKNPVYGDYIRKSSQFKFLPRVHSAVKKLSKNGYTLIVISNQAGVAKGLFTKKDLDMINKKMLKTINNSGSIISGIYYCIHHPDANCACRKPKTGLIKKAIGGTAIDKNNSFFIGDTERDISTGKRFKVKTVLVLSGYSKKSDIKKWKVKPDFVAKDLYDAVKIIKGGKQ